MVYVWHKQTELAYFFLFCSCVYFCLYDPFNCILLPKLSPKNSVFSLCSSRLFSALLDLSTISLYESLLQPRYNSFWLTSLTAPTNKSTLYENSEQPARDEAQLKLCCMFELDHTGYGNSELLGKQGGLLPGFHKSRVFRKRMTPFAFCICCAKCWITLNGQRKIKERRTLLHVRAIPHWLQQQWQLANK